MTGPKGNDGSGYAWVEATAGAAFPPRDGAGALVFKNRMWLIGGWHPSDRACYPRMCANDVWSSADGRAWTQEKENTFHSSGRTFRRRLDWEGRHTAGYAVFREKMWIVGGDANQGHHQYDVWNSDDGKTWTYVNTDKPVPWGPRALHAALVFRDRLWVLGGQTMPHFADVEEAFYNDIWCSEDGVEWTRRPAQGPLWEGRATYGACVVFKDAVWLLGGSRYGTPAHPDGARYNDVWCSADGRTWERALAHAPWQARAYHDTAVFDGNLWVMAGTSSLGERLVHRNDVWYSDNGIRWRELPGTPWAPRHAASVFVYDDSLWVVAGNNLESDVWRLVKT